MRSEEHGWTRIKAMERISEPIIGRKTDGGVFGRPRTAASRRSDSQNVRPNGVHFSVTVDESAPVADLEGLRTRGLEIPADRNRLGPRNPSSTAKQNDKIPQGNIYRGVGGSFSNSTLNEVFPP